MLSRRLGFGLEPGDLEVETEISKSISSSSGGIGGMSAAKSSGGVSITAADSRGAALASSVSSLRMNQSGTLCNRRQQQQSRQVNHSLELRVKKQLLVASESSTDVIRGGCLPRVGLIFVFFLSQFIITTTLHFPSLSLSLYLSACLSV